MIRSMTGFGRATRTAGPRHVTVEARSVNHRYFKITTRLPATLAGLEGEIEAHARAALRRGSVTLQVRYEDQDAAARFELDTRTARRHLEALRALAADLGLPADAHDTLLHLVVGLPGVVRETDASAEPDETGTELVLATVDEALAALDAARQAEGKHLARILEGHLGCVRSLTATIASQAQPLPEACRDRLLERVRRLLRDATPDAVIAEGDLLREACLLADRLDVTEELRRLEAHTVRFGEIVSAGEDAGRPLDFLLQELNREANTIGSKVADAEVAHRVVELKSEIERMREQAQNVA